MTEQTGFTTPEALPAACVAAIGAQLEALSLSDRALDGNDAARPMAVPELAVVQPVYPTIAWDWTATTGTTDPAQHLLLDSIPGKVGPHQQFVRTGYPMSQAYADLVRIIVSFPDPDALTKARAAVIPPAGEPADTASPPGWTKVPDGAGILRWQPDWSVSTTPDRWLAEVVGESQSPTKLRIPLRELAARDQANLVMAAGADATLQPLASSNGELHMLEITARAWGCVLVGPGGWFDPEIPALAPVASFPDGCPVGRLLGPRGVLKGQITGLLVAAEPRATLTVDASYWRRHESQLKSARRLRLAGWSFGSIGTSPGQPALAATVAETGTVVVSVTSTCAAPPQIAGIYVHPFRL